MTPVLALRVLCWSPGQELQAHAPLLHSSLNGSRRRNFAAYRPFNGSRTDAHVGRSASVSSASVSTAATKLVQEVRRHSWQQNPFPTAITRSRLISRCTTP